MNILGEHQNLFSDHFCDQFSVSILCFFVFDCLFFLFLSSLTYFFLVWRVKSLMLIFDVAVHFMYKLFESSQAPNNMSLGDWWELRLILQEVVVLGDLCYSNHGSLCWNNDIVKNFERIIVFSFCTWKSDEGK